MSFDKTLVDAFDLEGRWGLPDWPVEKWLHGKAHFDPQAGTSLKVDGLLGEMPAQIPSKLDEYPAVYGATNDSNRVTLLDVSGGFGGMNLGQAGTIMSGSYHALRVIVGEFVPSTADLKYRSVAVRFHNLEEFFGRHGFDQKVEKGSATISYKLPASVDMKIDDIPVTAEYHAGLHTDEFERWEIWQRARFTAKPESETQLDLLLGGVIASLHYLVEFAVGHRLPILQIEAHSSRTDLAINEKFLRNPIQIFMSQKRPLPLPPRETPMSLLFTLAALGPDASLHVENWHRGFKAFRDALDFYFSFDPEVDTDVGLEHHFLTAANAFESLHRIVGKTQLERSQAEHEDRVTKILDSTPGDFRKWLKGKLRHSNEVSLEQRLRDSYAEMPEGLRPILGGEDFPKVVATTRNALIHHTESLKERALNDPKEIWLATKRLRLIMQVQFLRGLGLDERVLPQIVDRSSDYQILRQEMAWQNP